MKDIIVGGNTYQYQGTIKGEKAINLDRKVLGLFMSLDISNEKVNNGKVADDYLTVLLCRTFSKMNDLDFENLVVSTLSGVVFVGNDETKSFSLNKENIFNHFFGKLNNLYELMVEVWEAASLSVFTMGKSTGN